MKKLLAVCLMALVCWVCAGYAEETRVGDTVIFGQYEQDGNLDNGSEPIAWQVLDVQGGKALLMSRYALDCLPFHDEKNDAAWNQSALNAWLQADFHAAFTDAEWAAIAPVTLADTAADGNPEWQNTDAEPAETHVFLLSYAQVMQYLPEQEQRKVRARNMPGHGARSFWASPPSASAKRTGGCARRARKATTRAFWMSAARSERSA